MDLSRIRRAALAGVLVAVCAVPVASAGTEPSTMHPPPAAGCEPTDDTPSARGPVPPAGAAECTSVRPGDFISSEFGGTTRYCTAAFFYKDRRGDTYFATSGNCAPPFVFEDTITTWKRGSGPPVMDGRTGSRIGEFAFRFGDGDVAMSLVRLDPAVPVSPQVCQYGGPIGMTEEVTDDPTQLVMVGPQGGFLQWDFDPYAEVALTVMRPGLAHFGLYDKDVFLAQGETFSEDGMPVMTADGQAVGIVGTIFGNDAHGTGLFHVGMQVVRLRRPLAHAERVLRTKLTLLTAPLL